MQTAVKVPLNSKWQSKNGKVYVVVEKHPFGKVSIFHKASCLFTDLPQKRLLANFQRVEA